MIFLLVVIFAGLFLVWYMEETPWEEKRMIKQLIKQSYENERRRMRHRGTAYTQCGWKPPKMKRRGRTRPIRFYI